MSAVIDSLARHLQERVNKAEPEVERLRQRVAELEAMVRANKAMLDEIAAAAGLGVGDSYSAQALIAVGSGGFNGTGLFQGEQTHGRFVPEQHTDFIFTVAGEELGFVGAMSIIALMALILWRLLRIGLKCDLPYPRLICVGVATWFGFQSFINIGMCLGLMPVTGIPLPFVSYGGTALLANMFALGLVLGIHARNRGFE